MTALRGIASGCAELAAEVVGDGCPVVFFHSNACGRREWDAQLAGIGAAHRAIAYDRRGFGETRAEEEDHSAVADLMAVLDATTDGSPAVVVGCSLGGKIALDAALRRPRRVRALVLIAPTVQGAPEAVHPPGIGALLAGQKEAEMAGDLDRLNRIKARLWLDGPLAPEGCVGGATRQLFLDKGAVALRSPPVGPNLDTAPAYDRLGEISVPVFVIWGDLDFPHIQARCRHLVAAMRNGLGRELSGAAHLPSLERPAEVTKLIAVFLTRGRSGQG